MFGEVGLLGEVRAVSDASLRLKEAVSLGFRWAFLPAGNAGEAAAFPDLAVVPLRSVEELLAKTLTARGKCVRAGRRVLALIWLHHGRRPRRV